MYCFRSTRFKAESSKRSAADVAAIVSREGSTVCPVSMPWAAAETPSLQVGLLTALADASGLATRPFSFHLAMADFMVERGFTLRDYDLVAHTWWTEGLGDWLFRTPPLTHQTVEMTAAYVAHLREAGAPSRLLEILDDLQELAGDFVRQACSDVLAADPAVVAFTTSFSQNVPSLALAAALKQVRPDLITVFGGANCDGPAGPALLRAYDVVDIVVQGEAEPVFGPLCSKLLAGSTLVDLDVIPGVLVRGARRPAAIAQRAAMADVPTPDYDEYFDRLAVSRLANELNSKIRLVIESSRGCWWGQHRHCKFCGLNGSSMTYRAKSAGAVLSEIDFIARRYRRTNFDVADNILDTSFFQTLLPDLRGRRQQGFDYRFFYEVKANLQPAQVKALRDAGVFRIQPGIESLSSSVLKHMGKGVSALQNVRLLLYAARYDIQVTWNIIYGIPGETSEDFTQMQELVPSLVHLKPPALVPLQVQRFSPYFDNADEYGLKLLGPKRYYSHVYDLSDVDLESVAYTFDYAHLNGYEPESAVASLRASIDHWNTSWTGGRATSFVYERGPGYLRLIDRRPGLAPRDVILDEAEHLLYLACESGSTPARAIEHAGLTGRLREAEVREFFEVLVAERLMMREGNWYLSLALPLTPDAAVAEGVTRSPKRLSIGDAR